MDVDRFAIAGGADQRDDALRLAERVSADEMRAVRELAHRIAELSDLAAIVGMSKDRQREGRLGDEDIAGDRFEPRTSRVGTPLVVAGGDDPRPILLHRDLRRTEHMTGRMKRNRNTIDAQRRAE